MRSTPTKTFRKDLVADTRGAILIVGIFMTLFLVGVLWYVLGIGQALVYHDHMQEAADAVTFSGAVVHARFMNMIVAMNLIMLALVAVHLILALINAVAIIALIVAEACCAAVITSLACCPTVPGFIRAQGITHKILYGYDKLLEPALWALSTGQTGLAIGALPVAAVVAITTGLKYKDDKGATIKGTALSMSYPEGFGDKDRLGLPVHKQKARILCQYLIQFFPLPSGIGKIAGGGLAYLFCDNNFVSKNFWVPLMTNKGLGGGKYWTDTSYGPKEMWDNDYGGGSASSKGKNGSDWLMVYGGIAFQGYDEVSEHDVAIAGYGAGLKGTDTNPNRYPFFAAGEFYYDCDSTWNADQCDNAAQGPTDRAMYSIGWKARLVRWHLPVVGPLPGLAKIFNPIAGFTIFH